MNEAVQTRARVLYVDDDGIVLEALDALLGARFDMVTARDAKEALRTLVASGPFDIVISDFAMPGMNGAEFLAKARALSPLSVRILLTGHASMEGVIEAINRAAIFRFITKPCAPGELMQVLESAAAHVRLATAERSLAMQVLDDATERARLAEKKLEALSAHLRRAEQLASLGTMASSIGHELNNVMATFGCTVDFVRDAVATHKPALAADLELLDQTRKHIVTHAKNLLHLGKPASPLERAANTDLIEVIRSVSELLRNAGLLRGVTLCLCLPESAAAVHLPRTEVEQLLINLIKNAIDAVKSTTNPRIEISVVLGDGGRRVACAIRDNGHGIPADKLPLIFEPFFTTMPADRGTGLGLFVVRNLIEGIGGTISVGSEHGAGATFRFELPVAEAIDESALAARLG